MEISIALISSPGFVLGSNVVAIENVIKTLFDRVGDKVCKIISAADPGRMLTTMSLHLQNQSPRVRGKAVSGLSQAFDRARQTDSVLEVLQKLVSLHASGGRFDSFIEVLLRRHNDQAPAVRKAAVKALATVYDVTQYRGFQSPSAVLQALGDACLDPSSLVRKEAISLLSDLVAEARLGDEENTTLAEIVAIWVTSVLPLVLDPETSVQERCLSCVEEVVLKPIAEADDSTRASRIAWTLIARMDASSMRYMECVLTSLNRAGAIPRELPLRTQHRIAQSALFDQVQSSLEGLCSSLTRAVLTGCLDAARGGVAVHEPYCC